jgi:hypothetical protein
MGFIPWVDVDRERIPPTPCLVRTGNTFTPP